MINNMIRTLIQKNMVGGNINNNNMSDEDLKKYMIIMFIIFLIIKLICIILGKYFWNNIIVKLFNFKEINSNMDFLGLMIVCNILFNNKLI